VAGERALICYAAQVNSTDAMRHPSTGKESRPESGPGRFPFINRVCFHLNWIFVVLWLIYLGGPDATGVLQMSREGALYGSFLGLFFLIHFFLVGNGIIALFVVIIEVYSRRPVRGFRSVLTSLGLPIVSFLYFSIRYLVEVRQWLEL